MCFGWSIIWSQNMFRLLCVYVFLSPKERECRNDFIYQANIGTEHACFSFLVIYFLNVAFPFGIQKSLGSEFFLLCSQNPLFTETCTIHSIALQQHKKWTLVFPSFLPPTWVFLMNKKNTLWSPEEDNDGKSLCTHEHFFCRHILCACVRTPGRTVFGHNMQCILLNSWQD